MYYLDREALTRNSTAGRSLGLSVPALLLLFFVLSLAPGMTKGTVIGHEFGTAAMIGPLRLPLIRPVYLKAGETLRFEYSATIRSGHIIVTSRFGRNLLDVLTADPDDPALSVSATQSGSTRFTAARTGYYLFWPTIRETGGYRRDCREPYTAFWRALINEKTDCATYNVSYSIRWS
ncbi:hypothetical protein [Rhabdaerophilum sp. SD176]|uniref:hypothetical protein n=1 Tax=Rhabdaerophilum sp. SD176 TaxID=2983548 RepID=UPI0024E0409F|nr:hypothetical protein [Rhabdaerophilum sp. SD176]